MIFSGSRFASKSETSINALPPTHRVVPGYHNNIESCREAEENSWCSIPPVKLKADFVGHDG